MRNNKRILNQFSSAVLFLLVLVTTAACHYGSSAQSEPPSSGGEYSCELEIIEMLDETSFRAKDTVPSKSGFYGEYFVSWETEQFNLGDKIVVTYDGSIQESSPAKFINIIDISLVEAKADDVIAAGTGLDSIYENAE